MKRYGEGGKREREMEKEKQGRVEMCRQRTRERAGWRREMERELKYTRERTRERNVAPKKRRREDGKENEI